MIMPSPYSTNNRDKRLGFDCFPIVPFPYFPHKTRKKIPQTLLNYRATHSGYPSSITISRYLRKVGCCPQKVFNVVWIIYGYKQVVVHTHKLSMLKIGSTELEYTPNPNIPTIHLAPILFRPSVSIYSSVVKFSSFFLDKFHTT